MYDARTIPDDNTGKWEHTYLNTIIADAAVRAARWTIKLTSCTPFHTHCDSLYVDIFVQRSTKIIVSDFVIVS